MLVNAILTTKGDSVVTLLATATLADAVALLNQHNIGAAVVVDDTGAVSGIVSERDLVRRFGKDHAAAFDLTIESIMTTNVITCTGQTPIADVMSQMTARRIRHMPVVDGKKLVGIISIGDVVKFTIEQAERETAAMRDYIAS